MEQAMGQFLAYLQVEKGCAENTLLAYRADLRQLTKVVSAKVGRASAPSDLTPETLASYVNWLMERGYRATTISRKMAAVRSFLEFLGREKDGAGLKLAGALRPPVAPRQQPRVLTQGEANALLQAPAKLRSPRGLRDSALLALLYATGLRATEVVSLRVEDIDLARGLVFRRGVGAVDDQPLLLGAAADPIRLYLQEGRPHLARNPEEPTLFLNQRGRHLSRQGLWLVIKRWAEASGLKDEISPHTLRHSLAHHLLEAGKTRRQVRRLLGLSSPNTLGRRSESDLRDDAPEKGNGWSN
jgi:integrase/recombinase XerD